MLPYVGTAFVGVALVAELVDVFSLDGAMAEATVGIVAIGAFYFAFDYRVMGKLIGLRTNVLVTFKTFFRLLCCWFGGFVNRVAGYA